MARRMIRRPIDPDVAEFVFRLLFSSIFLVQLFVYFLIPFVFLPLAHGQDLLDDLSLEGMIRATGVNSNSFCKACFDGEYPVAPDTAFNKLSLGS